MGDTFLSEISINEEKEERIRNLFKSFRELDACIEPYQEQKKELRSSYVENKWLTNEEFSIAKKAYNALKHKTNLSDVQIFAEIGKSEMP